MPSMSKYKTSNRAASHCHERRQYSPQSQVPETRDTTTSRVLRSLRRPARSERIGQLLDSENSSITVPSTLALVDASQQAQVVFLDGILSALLLEFGLSTMPIENEVRRRWVGEQASQS